MNFARIALAAAFLAASAAVPARAQRLIAWPIGMPRPIFFPPRPMPMPPIPRPDMVPLPLKEQKVEGSVKMQVAQLWIETVFRNDSSRRLEGEILMPIPGDAVIDKMEMKVGDKLMKAELLDAAAARTTYENIVRQMRDPALLELQGERLVRARVFPIEPNSSVTLRFNYTQILPKAGALYSLKLPLARIDGSGGNRSVKVGFESQAPMRLLYSPTHSVDIDRQGDKKATVGYKTGGPESELVVLYSLDEGKMSSSILTHREAGEDGFFMLSLSPSVKTDAKSQPKDIVFVVDRSGSMEDDGKMEQARKALKSTLNRLTAEDRFGIVDFATGVESMSESLLAADEAGKNRGRRYADKIEASGGTNIKEALDTALDLLGKGGAAAGRMPMLVFLTDGLPTVGETNTDELLRAVHGRNKAVKARFFCLGAGKDVNSLFIDKLAEGQRGSRDYVLPGEDIEVKVGQMVDRIAKPAITDVSFEWNGVEAAQVYPKGVTDIYFGDPVLLVGRYPKEGKGSLVLTGKNAAGNVRQEFPLALPKEHAEDDYLPRLWAHRKVAHLLDEIRLTGSKNPEIVDEVIKLAKRYGIVTPYTSLLIAEDSDMAQLRDQGRVMFERMGADAGALPAPEAGPQGGGGRFAVSAIRGQAFSRNLMAMKSAAAAPAPAEAMGSFAPGAAAGAADASGYYGFEISAGGGGGEAKLKKLASEMRSVGSKTFYKRGSAWVDGAYELAGKPSASSIVFLSDAYFELMRRHPETRSWLSLGRSVTFMLAGKAYRIVEK
ncbi:MAG: VWA domain-containing protein [Elusimicrobia bacterium]|nr:VWA domain-containing protein [Elusimicrobiota bacterium]